MRKLIKIHDLIQIQNFKTSLYVWEDPKKKKKKKQNLHETRVHEV